MLEPEKQIMTIAPLERMDRNPWHVSDEPGASPPPLPAPKTAGIKRERETDSLPPPRPPLNGAPPGPGMVSTPNGVGIGAGAGRAGVEGARPRPKKKQRLVCIISLSHFGDRCSLFATRRTRKATRGICSSPPFSSPHRKASKRCRCQPLSL